MERIKHAQHRTRAESVRAAGNAGTDPLRTYNMQNTNDYLNSENTKRLKQQAINETVPYNDIEEAASLKPQAASCKLQAGSSKLQAASPKPQA